ncbi:MAG: hypothetical protein ACPLSP_04170 [Fervidicoccus fontis]
MLLIPSPRLKTGFMLLNPSEIQKSYTGKLKGARLKKHSISSGR